MSKDTIVRTTSKKNATKILILSHALKLFNERGIEDVGVREIANDLNIRVGNVTYYFPTKDDIVVAIAGQLAELNSKTIRIIDGLSMLTFLNMYKQVFANHHQFRCLFYSFIQQLKHNKKLQSDYQKTQQKRFATQLNNINELHENGYLKKETTEDQIHFIASSSSLIARFWLSEARISYNHLSRKDQVKRYLLLIGNLLKPYATKKGLKEIEEFAFAL